MGMQDEETAVEVGNLVADLISKSGKRAVIIASSDFTHYETAERAKEIDSEVIDAVLNFNISGMYDSLYRRNASVCGYGPIAAMLTASQKLGGSKATLLKYANSGDVSGDTAAVVGYAAIIVE
jgi:AmmeMemoRadiSam system protein B